MQRKYWKKEDLYWWGKTPFDLNIIIVIYGYNDEGVMNINRIWLIPKTANKPADGRYKANKNQDGAD